MPPALKEFLADEDLPLTQASAQLALHRQGPELAFNLLRDPAADLQEISQIVRRWRMPMAAMITGAATLSAALWLETSTLRETASDLRTQASAVARAAFIPSGPILNMRAQVGNVIATRQQAQSQDSENRAIQLLANTTTSLAAQGINVSRLRLTRTGTVRLDLEVADFSSLEALTSGMSDQRTAVRVIASAVDPSGGVAAEIDVAWAP